jgi:hypothetical protein
LQYRARYRFVARARLCAPPRLFADRRIWNAHVRKATGCRLGSLRGLTWADWDFGTPTVPFSAKFDKRKWQRTVPVTPELADAVKIASGQTRGIRGSWLFQAESGDEPWPRDLFDKRSGGREELLHRPLPSWTRTRTLLIEHGEYRAFWPTESTGCCLLVETSGPVRRLRHVQFLRWDLRGACWDDPSSAMDSGRRKRTSSTSPTASGEVRALFEAPPLVGLCSPHEERNNSPDGAKEKQPVGRVTAVEFQSNSERWARP